MWFVGVWVYMCKSIMMCMLHIFEHILHKINFFYQNKHTIFDHIKLKYNK